MMSEFVLLFITLIARSCTLCSLCKLFELPHASIAYCKRLCIKQKYNDLRAA